MRAELTALVNTDVSKVPGHKYERFCKECGSVQETTAMMCANLHQQHNIPTY